MRKSAITVLVASILALTACSSSTSPDAASATAAGDQLPLVATTVSPITSIAASVGGDRVRVEGIVPEGTNSHTFEPAPQVAQLLSTADLILVNGLKLEDPTLDLAETNKKDEAAIVEVGTSVIPESDYIYDFSFPKEDGKPNPHLWTDPLYAIKYAAVIRDEFTKLDPAGSDYYAANYDAFEKKATELADARARRPRVGAGWQPQVADISRCLRVLREGLRLGGHRGAAAQELLRSDADRGRGPDRPGHGAEGADDLRLRGLPVDRARGDRTRDGCPL